MAYKNIKIVPYNPNWPLEFEQEAKKIKNALGNNCVTIHHIGSTSVPGLSAKPIIDIMPVVKSINLVTEAIRNLGYETGNELFIIPFRRFFSKGKELRTHNVHVFEENAPEIDCHLKYRDWLINYSKDRDAYAKLKENLAAQYPDDMNSYYNGKEEFILNLGAKAGWGGLRMLSIYTDKEIDKAKFLRQKYIFDQASFKDPYLWTFEKKDHIHFVLYKGPDIIGYVHLQLWPANRAAMRIIAIDGKYRNYGYGGGVLMLCEKGLKNQ